MKLVLNKKILKIVLTIIVIYFTGKALVIFKKTHPETMVDFHIETRKTTPP